MINLETFDLIEYNELDLDHRIVTINLWNDKSVSSFMGDIEEFIFNVINSKSDDNYNNIYLVEKNNSIIGLVSLYCLDTKYEICYAILEQYRNNHYASKLLKEFSNYVFNNTNIDNLYLYINKSNIVSLKVASNNGYLKTGDVEYKKGR